MLKLLFLLMLAQTFTANAAIIFNADQYQGKAHEAAKYYQQQEYRKSIKLLFTSCAVAPLYGCDLLSDIYVGLTSAAPRVRSQQPLTVGQPQDLERNGFEFLKGMSPFERLIRLISLPDSAAWRLYLKLYPLRNMETGEYTAFLTVADFFDGGDRIIKYATVYHLVPMGGGSLENSYISQNRIVSESYPCGLLRLCSNLQAASEGRWGLGKHLQLEKAPWEREHQPLPALIRALDYAMGSLQHRSFDVKDGTRRHFWEWELNKVPKSLKLKPFATLIIEKRGNNFTLTISERAEDGSATQYLAKVDYDTARPAASVDVQFAARCATGVDSAQVVPKCP